MSESVQQSFPPIYLLPGIIRDDRDFQRLGGLLSHTTVLDWIDPVPNETLQTYAQRIAEQIPTSECVIVGVSFGGVVAQEVSRLIQPKQCFIISSIRHPSEVLWVGRFCRFLAGRRTPHLLNLVGWISKSVPRRVRARFLTRFTLFAGEQGAWYRWATSEVLNWKPQKDPIPTSFFQVHGETDRTFPICYQQPDVIIKGAGHTLVISHPEKVAEAILAEINEPKQREG